jgi:hypothetical protein
MPFPFERYAKITAPLTVYYPADEETLARWIVGSLDRAAEQLATLLNLPRPELQVVIVTPEDWSEAPNDEPDEPQGLIPYLAYVTPTPSLVVPLELDPILGEPTQEKLAFALYRELVLIFLEDDPRPWPDEIPLWADEWQIQFAALWLVQTLNSQQGMVNKDLAELNSEIFEPEADGKTPDTVRGFDWFEDTTPEDFLAFELLLERFAADLLTSYGPEILPRFLELYRTENERFLSDEVTNMLAEALGPGGAEWLEALVYF